MGIVEVGDIKIGKGHPLVFVGGPCVIERESHLALVGKQIKIITDELGIPFILKTSFDNFYVCDASTFPDALVRPPTLTIIALGKRLARHLNAGVLARSERAPARVS